VVGGRGGGAAVPSGGVDTTLHQGGCGGVAVVVG